jgi:uncharacterized protein (TIGR03437 family)
MSKVLNSLVALLVAGDAVVFAEKPVIKPNGVVNAASYTGSVKGESLVVGGSIFTIFGENLATTEQKASSTPLPTKLAGTSVTVGEIAAPLFYVSPGQVNFQAPHAIGPVCRPSPCTAGRVGERLPVVVTTAAGASDPVLAFVEEASPGIFTQGSGGCGQGTIQNVAADGSLSLNTPSNSASPGSFITIYGTGLGKTYFPPEDGQPARVQPLTLLDLPGVSLGVVGYQWSPWVRPSWAGFAPGLVGVNQVNVLLPGDSFEGCAVPVQVLGGWAESPPVTISIRKGGGPCQDAPPARFASIAWRKVITTSPESPSGEIQASFSASFSSAPENLVVPLADPPDLPYSGCRCGGMGIPVSPQCRGAGLTSLDAGGLQLTGVPGGPLTVLPTQVGDETEYISSLPVGSLDGGTVRVVGAGGAGVGAFEANAMLPPPIRVTTSLAPGTVIDYYRPFRVAWTGGSPEMLVRMQLAIYNNREGMPGFACDCPVLATAGSALLDLFSNPATKPPEATLQIGARSENAEVVLTVTPLTSKIARFVAPGLTREGRHEWSYEYHFKGLKIR